MMLGENLISIVVKDGIFERWVLSISLSNLCKRSFLKNFEVMREKLVEI